jgi:hypothetical protein
MDAHLINPDVDYMRLDGYFRSCDFHGVYEFLGQHCDTVRQKGRMLSLYLQASGTEDNVCVLITDCAAHEVHQYSAAQQPPVTISGVTYNAPRQTDIFVSIIGACNYWNGSRPSRDACLVCSGAVLVIDAYINSVLVNFDHGSAQLITELTLSGTVSFL